MTPTQRKAAERLIVDLESQFYLEAARQAAIFLRELLAEPHGEPVREPCNKSCAPGYCYYQDIAAPQQRKPLTDAQIKTIWWQCEAKLRAFESPQEWWCQFARAIERAHGITGEPT